ncbi:ribonuclease HII [Hankyongella ginsenosidimutans]|uniref:Ribonuclease HII n=1 Tax=Hankyongella ginsenosidimutans TaxID=1763828 RepID=A0A4D7C743_9SPHN|nr:ribonuclease HII [Hankyongella ginsenosidimutans]QCI79800.1 ribonuclease HII [Hankyongella ginsenosidimutans]
MPDYALEAGLAGPVAGVDEAGRGPWAGPVLAAAVILDPARIPAGLNDSKALTARRRDALFEAIHEHAIAVGVGQASVAEIDAAGVGQANRRAMQRAVAALSIAPRHALIDGIVTPDLPCPARAVVKGDARSLSIAAASIIAKVTRDRIMLALDADHPAYCWRDNMGYGTAAHAAALQNYGPCPHHRLSFRPVAAVARAFAGR